MTAGAGLNPAADLNLVSMTTLWHLADEACSMELVFVCALVISLYVFEERGECRYSCNGGLQALDGIILLQVDVG